MRITKQALVRRWAFSTAAALIVFAVMAWSDHRLKQMSGVGTLDLQGLRTAAQYRWAFLHWPSRYAARACFVWGVDCLLMPLYAAALFYSGILTRQAFAPRPGGLYRFLTLLSAVPIAAAVLDALENVLEFEQMLSGPSDRIAGVAFTVSTAKWMGVGVGLLLFAAAVIASVVERRRTGAQKPV